MSSKSRIETPLHYYAGQKIKASSTSQNADVVITEYPLQCHLIVRGRATDPDFVDGIALATKLNISATPNQVISFAQESIYWLGPSEWLLVSPYGGKNEMIQSLKQHLRGHVAVIDVSGGQTMLNLKGDRAHEVLMKSSVYDFHPDNFPQGKCVQTTFAKAGALINRIGDKSFDLVIRRSFADYILQWLHDSASEYGCKVEISS